MSRRSLGKNTKKEYLDVLLLRCCPFYTPVLPLNTHPRQLMYGHTHIHDPCGWSLQVHLFRKFILRLPYLVKPNVYESSHCTKIVEKPFRRYRLPTRTPLYPRPSPLPRPTLPNVTQTFSRSPNHNV